MEKFLLECNKNISLLLQMDIKEERKGRNGHERKKKRGIMDMKEEKEETRRKKMN